MKFTPIDSDSGVWIIAAGVTYGPYSDAAASELKGLIEKEIFPFDRGTNEMPSPQEVDKVLRIERDLIVDETEVPEPPEIKPR